jgi:hypothetical protein
VFASILAVRILAVRILALCILHAASDPLAGHSILEMVEVEDPARRTILKLLFSIVGDGKRSSQVPREPLRLQC